MLLLTGPPASGKRQQILEQVRKALRRGESGFRLLVPTATMAEHIRNELAREGFLLRPNVVETLSRFIEPWVRDIPEVSGAELELLVGEILDQGVPREFQKVARLPGFRACLASLVDEFRTAGCKPEWFQTVLETHGSRLRYGAAFHDVFARVHKELERRGWSLRAGRLRHAAERIRERGLGPIGQIFLDGFFSFTDPELELLFALSQRANLTVTLPLWRGAATARVSLLAMGFQEVLLGEAKRPPVKTVLFTAAGLEQESEEIARRILAEAEAGRAFREIGVIVRSEKPYVPLLRAAFERYGVPARFYFAPPLAEHSIVRYFAAVIDAMLDGWDHEKTLAAIRMSPSGVGVTDAGDRFDFEVREHLPGAGLAELRNIAPSPGLQLLIDRFAQLESWRSGAALPAEWAARTKTLRGLVRPPRITDGVDYDTVLVWRGQAAALEAFDQAMDETAEALPAGERLPFTKFWEAARTVLQGSRLRVADRRRNVVHVLDVYEARQWELPVVFLCGLLERQFPLYHGEDPVFPDSARSLLQRQGIRLWTTADRRLEEEFLFDLATTRATSELVLSYPESNAQGEPNLPSFFLQRFTLAPERAQLVRPKPIGVAPPCSASRIGSPELLERLRAEHAVLKATAIEDFLACPFQFFIRHTLKLEEPPPWPEDRLNPGLQGVVVHQVLAEWYRNPQPIEPLFERVFAEACARERVLEGCAKELARLSMLRDLRRFLEAPLLLEGWSVSTEKLVQFPLAEDLEIRGRIDRFDVSPENLAVVFDFKYSRAAGIRDRVREFEEGKAVQTGLYLLALEHETGAAPAGMFYCGLRGETRLDGWHTSLPGFEAAGTSCTRAFLREQLDRVKDLAIHTAEEIRAGRIEPCQSDRCERCDYRDLCRLETAEEAAVAGGSLGLD